MSKDKKNRSQKERNETLLQSNEKLLHSQKRTELNFTISLCIDSFTIEGKDLTTIKIFNIKGQLIKKYSINNNLHTINLNEQSKGIYLVKILTKNGIRVKKCLLLK
ncbi:MAG: T9SS type A sorting domain-containing protein [Candidatus Cloacimonetes bacterium]|nr:T9SS type A sorting domain-containing protein [Candidatus Cloacimonadota bacterium]MBT6994559.1 T9SS type A sorting domain-containing protein [Candidatus Cloacimonadota bacterium]